MKYHDQFKPGAYFHIYNHAVGIENLFRNEENFYYFLQKYSHQIYPVAKTIAYNLLPNHFHFLIKIRDEKILIERANESIEYYNRLQIETLKEKAVLKEFDSEKFDPHDFVMQRFSNLFNGYTKAYNKRFDRKGALFIDYLKRIRITDHRYLTNLIAYIHFNAVHHGFCKRIDDWKFSSYQTPISKGKTRLEREMLLQLFESKEKYIVFHQGFKDLISDELEFG